MSAERGGPSADEARTTGPAAAAAEAAGRRSPAGPELARAVLDAARARRAARPGRRDGSAAPAVGGGCAATPAPGPTRATRSRSARSWPGW